MSKIVLYQEAITGVTTNGEQYALFINEDGLPTVKNGSQVVVFGTSGYAMQGSSGSSGLNGTNGLSGTSGVDGSDGSSGQDGQAGSSGTSGQDGSSGSSGADGVAGDSGSSGSSGISYGTSGRSGSSGSSGETGSSGSSGLTALGASAKAGSVDAHDMIYVTEGPMVGFRYYDVEFYDAFDNANYSATLTTVNSTEDYYMEVTDKSAGGFRMYVYFDNPEPKPADTVFIDWLCVSHGETGVSGAPGSNGTSGEAGSSGSSGLSYGTSGISGTNGVSGMNGTSGTSGPGGGGGAINSKNYEIMNVDLTSGTTINGGWEYLGGMFGVTSHWGYDSSRNYEFGATYPVNIAEGKTLQDIIFPIEVDNLGSVPYKIVIWTNKPGSYYPDENISVDSFNVSPASTGYNVIEYNVNFTNDGTYQDGDLFFVSIWRFDSAGDKHRFRASVNNYQDVGYVGVFNPSTKDFASGYQFSMTTIYNSNWAGGGVPSTYGPGSYGAIYFGGGIPCFWRIS